MTVQPNPYDLIREITRHIADELKAKYRTTTATTNREWQVIFEMEDRLLLEFIRIEQENLTKAIE